MNSAASIIQHLRNRFANAGRAAKNHGGAVLQIDTLQIGIELRCPQPEEFIGDNEIAFFRYLDVFGGATHNLDTCKRVGCQHNTAIIGEARQALGPQLHIG